MYLFLDFETTGLDLHRDEPIQIGLLLVDHQRQIIRSYSSLIRPERPLEQLRTVVAHITGIDIKDLYQAPSRQQITQEIESFFVDNPLVIGHNISFDVGFLHKFFPQYQIKHTIDTFILSQYLIHYATSYALESLLDLIPTTHSQQKTSDTIHYQYHDALEDCKACMVLASYLEQQLINLSDRYQLQISGSNNSILSVLGSSQHLSITIAQPLPPLKKPVEKNSFDHYSSNIKEIAVSQCAQHSQHFLGHYEPEEAIIGIVKPYLSQQHTRPLIIATSAKQKLTAIKKICHSHGIYHLGFGKQEQTFDSTKRSYFQHKATYTLHEALFFWRYCGHHAQGLSVLHLCTQEQYQIFDFLAQAKSQENYTISLFTHHGLFHRLTKEHPPHTIVCMDPERWYKSYNSFLNNPLDWYTIIQFWENISYGLHLSWYDHVADIAKIRRYVSAFVGRIQVFVGLCGIETTRLFTGTPDNKRTIDPISSNNDFRLTYKSRTIVHQRREYIESLPCWDTEQRASLKQSRTSIVTLFDTILSVEKKVNHHGQIHYMYHTAVNYTSFPEFLEQFGHHQVIFLSTIDPHKPWHNNQHKTTYQSAIQYEQTNDIQKILHYINQQIKQEPTHQSSQTIVIMTDSSLRAKQVFEQLYKKKLGGSSYHIYAENASGGTQKILTQVIKQQQEKRIIIGGYQFLLSIATAGIAMPPHIMVYSASSQFVQQMISDIGRRSS